MGMDGSALGAAIHSHRALLPPVVTGGLMAAVLVGLARYSKRHGEAEAARSIGLLLQFVCFFEYSALLPDALDLSEELGTSALYSGMLIGMMFVGKTLGTMVAWLALRQWPDMWRRSPRCVLTMSTALLLAATLGYTSVAGGARAMTPFAASSLLLCFRFVGGVAYGITQQLTQTIFIHVTPAPERSEQMVRVLFANMLGVGLGPVSVVAAISLASPADAAQRFSVGGGIQAVACLFALVGVVVIYPSMDAVTDHEDVPTPADTSTTHQDPAAGDHDEAHRKVFPAPDRQECRSEASTELLESGSASDQEEKDEIRRRYVVVTASLGMALVRNLITASLESATSMMLETKYQWDVRAIGVAIALSFLVAIPFNLVQTMLRRHLSLIAWIRVLTGMATAGSLMMLITGKSSLVGGGVLLLADTLLFPSLYFGDALNRGIMQQHLLPHGSIFDANTTTMWSTLVASGLGRSCGPPLARWCIDMGGQHTYALFQVTSCLVFASLFEGLVRPRLNL